MREQFLKSVKKLRQLSLKDLGFRFRQLKFLLLALHEANGLPLDQFVRLISLCASRTVRKKFAHHFDFASNHIAPLHVHSLLNRLHFMALLVRALSS